MRLHYKYQAVNTVEEMADLHPPKSYETYKYNAQKTRNFFTFQQMVPLRLKGLNKRNNNQHSTEFQAASFCNDNCTRQTKQSPSCLVSFNATTVIPVLFADFLLPTRAKCIHWRCTIWLFPIWASILPLYGNPIAREAVCDVMVLDTATIRVEGGGNREIYWLILHPTHVWQKD